MSLESFYGGKQGISPVIKNSFEFIDVNDPAYQAASASGRTETELAPLTMDICFSNIDYKDVWYDELCIIDTINKNNPNNGKIFRRTLKKAGDTGVNLCAEYIGRIVGPAGTSPFFSFGNLSSVSAQGTTEKIDLAPEMQVSYPVDESGNISSAKTDETGNPININPSIQTASIETNMLVPGKTSNGEYNDNIRYTWLNVLDDTREIPTRSIVYMGFEIPYPVLEITSTTIDWMNSSEIIKTDSSHPFYHPWNLTIPRGVRGNAAFNVRLTTWNEFNIGTSDTISNSNLYSFDDFDVDLSGKYTEKDPRPGPSFPWIHNGSINTQERDRLRWSYIWVYDYTFYDTTYEGQSHSKTYTIYLGSYREITNVNLESDGTLTFSYSDGIDTEFSQIIQWVKDIKVSNSGKLTFTYNKESFWKTADTMPQSGKGYYTYNSQTGSYSGPNTYTSFEAGTTYYELTDEYSKQLPYPTQIVINAAGEINIAFADNTDLTVMSSETETYKLDYVKAINMDNNTKVLSYTTTVNNRTVPLNGSKGINYIEAMMIDENYHLLVYYASNQYRPIDSPNYGTITWRGLTFRNNFPYSDDNNINISANAYWQDFGSVLEKSAGVKIYTKVKYKKDTPSENWPVHPQAAGIDGGQWSSDDFITGVLNPMYWDSPTNLIENPYYGGNIPGEDENTNYNGTFLFTDKVSNGSLFFYDYDYKWSDGSTGSWMYAGSMDTSTQVDVKIQRGNGSWLNPAQTLTDYGIVFKERATAQKTSLLPDFGIV